jgi:hypothetical protein
MKHVMMRPRSLFLLVLLYGLLVTVFDLDYNSVFIDEAYHITMGRELLRGDPCPGCPFATGSPRIHPTLAAIGDIAGGIHGARIVSLVFGLGLTAAVYLASTLLLGEALGVLAAALFIFTGQTLYLSKLATYDMTAAFFLGASFCMLVLSTRVASERHRVFAIVFGSIALFIAAATKYLLPVFMPALGLYVLFSHGWRRTILYCVLPIAALGALYVAFEQFAPGVIVRGQIETYRVITVPLKTIFEWAFRWIAFVLLLAVFGVFHEKHGKKAAMLIALGSPIILLHLVTRAEQSVNKNMIFALIFLVPAAAIGVDHMARIFSSGTRSRAVRVSFAAAIVTIYWAYGVFNLKWLERQYPDVTPIIEFFDENGFDGMVVAMNGWDGVIYEYTLADRFPRAKWINLRDVDAADYPEPAFVEHVDFVVCEDLFYGKITPCEQWQEYIDRDFALVRNFTIEHSWGFTDATIYGRR